MRYRLGFIFYFDLCFGSQLLFDDLFFNMLPRNAMLLRLGHRGQHKRRIAAYEEGGRAVGACFPLLERRQEGGWLLAGRSLVFPQLQFWLFLFHILTTPLPLPRRLASPFAFCRSYAPQCGRSCITFFVALVSPFVFGHFYVCTPLRTYLSLRLLEILFSRHYTCQNNALIVFEVPSVTALSCILSSRRAWMPNRGAVSGHYNISVRGFPHS